MNVKIPKIIEGLEKLSNDFWDLGSTAGDDRAQDAYYLCSERLDKFIKTIGGGQGEHEQAGSVRRNGRDEL